MSDHSLLNSIVIFVVMFVFNFLGATTGGSALITIPTCIFLGFDANEAIATTRLGALGSMIAGWYGFRGKNKLNYTIGLRGGIIAALGTIIGAYFMSSIPTEMLEKGLGVVMMVVLAANLLRKHLKQKLSVEQQKTPSPWQQALGYISLAAAGFLSGIFGGLGIILILILMIAFNKTLLEAAGTRVIINLFIALTAIIIYHQNGSINWTLAPVVLLGMLLGSYFGTFYGLKKGDQWAERIFNCIAFLMALKLIFTFSV